MLITKLEYQKKDKGRVNVYVDEKFAVGLGANDVIKLGIFKGQEISSQQLQKIISESEFGKMFNSALNFLSYRPRSEWEVRQRLRKKQGKDASGEASSSLIASLQHDDEVIDKLRAIGQIDDEAFCRWFIEQRTTFKPKGERALKYELARKGIPKEIISKVFETQEKGVSDFELATRIVKKKFGDKFDKERIQRFLASRGFDWNVIEEVVQKVYNNRSI